jgi:hypothetical protein
MILRRLTGAALVLLTADLALIVITGEFSLLAPFGLAPIGAVGFGVRAALAGALFVLRFRSFAPKAERLSGGVLALSLLLLPALVHFQVAGGRINGDGLSYYVFVHSLWKDGDFDLTNEYEHFGMLSRGDLQMPTKTGLRRTIYSVGPAVVWGPFFGLGELIGRADRATGGDPDLSGYGPYHRNAVALGSLLYGFFALLLTHALLRRHFSEGTALSAVLLVYFATFHYWYMVFQPTYSHATSAFFATLAITLWERGRGRSGRLAFLALGLVLGVAMSVRWQNGILLLLPALDLGLRWRRAPRGALALVPHALALGAGALLGAFPQMLAWKAIYDYWLLPYPPQGPGFVRLQHPFVLETLFSSRHGLLSWTPVFWLGFLGMIPLAKRRAAMALAFLPPLVLMTWVNMSVADYWGGASFSNRRFDSLLPVFAFGFAASIDVLRRFGAHRPRLATLVMAVLFCVWNLALAEQLRLNWIPADDTVTFPTLARNAAQLVSDRVGFPTTWPASWVFAARHGRPGQYDLVVGRYLFYMQNNLGGRVEIGVAGDEALLAEGWGGIEDYDGVWARRIKGRARLFASLDVPEDLELRLRVSAPEPRRLRVLVNGRATGELWAESGWGERRVAVPASFWRREVNDIAFVTDDATDVRVDAVSFVRTSPNPRRWA